METGKSKTSYFDLFEKSREPKSISEIANRVERDTIQLSENIYMFPSRTVGQRDNVYEGEVRSSVYGSRQCVIKFSSPTEQNVREAKILTQLGCHTNVIAIIQSGTYHDVFEDHVYIALDKCHDENLRQYLASRTALGMEFDVNEAMDFAKQILDGVTYIHDSNIIHLDLKPSNILISQDLRLIKIADFGSSIIVKSCKSKVFLKRQFGTNGYRPLESFGNGHVSQRSDVFSLGTVLYHLLSCGNDVYGGDEYIYNYNVMNDIVDTSGLLVKNPVTTEHLIKCMLHKERCCRPSIQEVSDHPCWTGEEVACNFAYLAADEIEDCTTNQHDAIVGELETSERHAKKDANFLEKMKELGFNRQPSIIVFDYHSDHLYIFDHRRGTMTKTHAHPDNILPRTFTAVAHGEYIYVFNGDRSVYKLEYGDSTAKWEEIGEWIGDHEDLPLVTASSKEIFLVGTRWPAYKPTRAVTRYTPSTDKWEQLKDKPTAKGRSALLCTNNFLYCFGGDDDDKGIEADRMHLATLQWTKIADLTRKRYVASAAESGGNIYVVGREFANEITMEMYNPNINQWTEMTPMALTNFNWSLFYFRCFAIGGNLVLVGNRGVLKYDIKLNEWSVVSSYTDDMYITEFVLVRMSRRR